MIIDIADIKAHLSIQSDEDDAILISKIGTASAHIEDYIGEKLANFDPVPEPIKEGVRRLATHLYINREPILVGMQSSALPYNVLDLIHPYRRWVF